MRNQARICTLTTVSFLSLLAWPGLAGAATEVRVQQISGLDVVVVVDDDAAGDIDTQYNVDTGSGDYFVAVQSAGGASPGAGCSSVTPTIVGCVGTYDAILAYGNGGNDMIDFDLIVDGQPPLHGEAYGGDGNDTLKAPPDNRNIPQPETYIEGEAGNDTIVSGNGTDELHGGEGADNIDAWQGADSVFGEGGDDLVKAGSEEPAANEADVLDGGDGFDELPGAGGDYNRGSDDDVAVTLDGVANDGEPGEGDNVVGVEKFRVEADHATITGSNAADDIFVDANTSTISGLGGNDRLVGYDGHDDIDGGDGDDYLEGGFGNDKLTGGPGVDQFMGDRTERDVIAIGNDTILARDGVAEQVNCGIGADSAQVDAADVVDATCESIDRAAAGPGPATPGPGGGGPGPAGPQTPPGSSGPAGVTVGLRSGGRLPRLGTALRSGLTLEVDAQGPGTVRVDLLASGRLAKVGAAKTSVVATGTAKVTKAGRVKVKVRFTAKAKRRYRKLRTLKLTARATFKASAGGATATKQLKLTLKR